ncbi:recQ [Mytilus coruscus]|uniref:DNA 3'-5' helicase n=1 Tax=Mytilus coruscus TaxID=42192 RepID=A0A6J8E9K0_MYTCO|nr:recQ [Mytilus coruscus]
MVCQEAAKESDPNAVIQRVSQYHSACTDQMKKIIVDDMADVNGNISLLFATEAYGMGADAPNIRRIIHYGPPTSVETVDIVSAYQEDCYLHEHYEIFALIKCIFLLVYMQEIGRAGRDGLQSEAVLYFNNNDLGSNTPVRDEVKQFCRLKSCRRQFLCEHFDWERVALLIKHNCCDICKVDCDCIECLSNSAFDDIDVAENDTEGTLSQLQSLLAAYFQLENDLVDMPKSEIFTGLSSELVHEIVKNCLSYKSAQEICRKFPFLKFEYACNIFKIILNVKSECPEV